MSGSLNKAMIIGNLTKDPEIRSTPNGNRVANFSVATNESYKDKDGNQKTSVEYHRLVAWGGLVDIIQKYLKKGDSAYFEGKITTRSWEDNNGVKKYSTEIVVYSLQLLGGKPSGDSQSQSGQQDMGGSPLDDGSDLPF